MLFTFLTTVTRWSRSTSTFYALIGQNLTGEFMRRIYAASWNLFTLTAEADRVLCQLVIFLTVNFHWMYKRKYSCYQESSVIHGCWLVYWVFGRQSRKSDFGWHRFLFWPCWMLKRIMKAQAILVLLDRGERNCLGRRKKRPKKIGRREKGSKKIGRRQNQLKKRGRRMFFKKMWHEC